MGRNKDVKANLLAYLKELRLPTMRAHFEEQARRAVQETLSNRSDAPPGHRQRWGDSQAEGEAARGLAGTIGREGEAMEEPSAELVARWRQGDQQAATALFERYAGQLIALTRCRMYANLARRIDAEDVVQSAYRSFFLAARDGRCLTGPGAHAWSLLVAITLRKLYDQTDRHTAGKRAMDREQNLDGRQGTYGLSAEVLARDPSPDEAAALGEELEQLMRELDPLGRQVLELWLQGKGLDEIAAGVQRSTRTIRRVLDDLHGRLEARCAGDRGHS